MASKWTAAEIPDQSGRVAVVTGANSGIGLVAARELARAGATVVIACRDTAKGQRAATAIGDAVPGADVEVAHLDLADLGSVRDFAASGAHRFGTMRFDDLQWERGYDNWRAYGQSKLANLLFCFELKRRATAAGTPLRSVAAHPGYAATNLQFAGPSRFYERGIMAITNRVIAQSAEMGA
jgi:NAD(P)-dependent dehydrogenase (short-subunit alcohol dehydrogenase family)